MKKANTYLILFPPVSYTLSYMQCGPQFTIFYGLRGIPYVIDYIGGLAAGPIKAKLHILIRPLLPVKIQESSIVKLRIHLFFRSTHLPISFNNIQELD